MPIIGHTFSIRKILPSGPITDGVAAGGRIIYLGRRGNEHHQFSRVHTPVAIDCFKLPLVD